MTIAAAGEAARTWLFAPADRPERCRKAARSGADQVIWDLEDGVAAAHKETARTALRTLLAECAKGEGTPWVRIGSPRSADGRSDLALLTAHRALGRIVVPKADARAVAELATATCRGEWLLIIESGRGLWDLAQGRLRVPADVEARLAFGALDYALDLGIEAGAGEDELLHARSEIVWLSRVMNLPRPIDSVHPGFRDPEAVAEAARRACRIGFGGKLAIHPAQLAPIESAFTPSAGTVAWARRVLAAAGSGRGAVATDGAMVDRPVVERARAILAAAGGGAAPPDDAARGSHEHA